jgi:hypothetical protein
MIAGGEAVGGLEEVQFHIGPSIHGLLRGIKGLPNRAMTGLEVSSHLLVVGEGIEVSGLALRGSLERSILFVFHGAPMIA